MTAPDITHLPAKLSGPTSPVVVYLASLGSKRSRRTQLQRLQRLGEM